MPPSARHTSFVATCLATIAPLRHGAAALLCGATSSARCAGPPLSWIGKVAVVRRQKVMSSNSPYQMRRIDFELLA